MDNLTNYVFSSSSTFVVFGKRFEESKEDTNMSCNKLINFKINKTKNETEKQNKDYLG